MRKKYFKVSLYALSLCALLVLVNCGGDRPSINSQISTLLIEPSQQILNNGGKANLQAYLVSSSGKQTNVTRKVAWSSSNTMIVSIDNKGRVIAKKPGNCDITASFQAKYANAQITVTAESLQRVEIQPVNIEIHLQEKQQYHAAGLYRDHNAIDLTPVMQWTTANDKIVTISKTGLAQAQSAGTTQISGIESSSGLKSTTTITVLPSSIINLDILPQRLTLGIGTSKKLTAKATFADQQTKDIRREVTWESQNINIASVNAAGKITGHSAGKTKISARFSTQTQHIDVQVIERVVKDVFVSPPSLSLPQGLTANYKAFALFGDGSQEDITAHAHWSAQNTAIARINDRGIVFAESLGKTLIKAGFEGKTGEANLSISYPALTRMDIYPSNVDFDFTIGMTAQLKVNGIYNNNEIVDMTQNVTWTSQHPETLSVIPFGTKAGLTEGNGEGQSVITAYHNESKQSATMAYQVTGTPLESISLTPSNVYIPTQNVIPFTATGRFADGKNRNITEDVLWSSSNTDIAEVSQQGIAAAEAPGKTTISVDYQLKQASTTLQVTRQEDIKAIVISPDNATISPASSQQFTATAVFNSGETVNITQTGYWTSSNPQIASVWNTLWLKGMVKTWGVKGTTEIRITYKGETAYVPLTITQ